MDDIARSEELRGYDVWDLQTRCFHWINATAVFGLIVVGIILLNDKTLGISTGGKVLLKQIHVALGYVMAANLIWRFVWAFLGNRYARWQAMVPYGPGYWGALRSYGSAFMAGEPQQFVGHNPAGRIGVVLLLLLLRLAGRDRARPGWYGFVLAAIRWVFCGMDCSARSRSGDGFSIGSRYHQSGRLYGNARPSKFLCGCPSLWILCAFGRDRGPSHWRGRD